jgi:putative tryptophan/tyrosine transport system substrate-binding protein
VSAQQADQIRRIAVLMTLTMDDLEGQARLTAFVQGLEQLGWTGGRNVRIDTRWGEGDANRYRSYAAELVAQAPDVILAGGGSSVGPLMQAKRTVPIRTAGPKGERISIDEFVPFRYTPTRFGGRRQWLG